MPRYMKNFGKMLFVGLCFWQLSSGEIGATGPGKPRGYVIVAESAGAQLFLSDNLANIVSEAGLPVQVEIVDWSTLHVPTDYQSHHNFAAKGQRMANRVMELKRKDPNAKIYIVGNGSGTTVAARCAELLPAQSVQRIFLLGPTVSCTYDIRRALQCSCEGIDVFFCKQDLTLELANQNRGTTDKGFRAPACAGLVGFTPQISSAADASLFAGLRQWAIKESTDPDATTLCHLRYMSCGFLRKHILPILRTSCGSKSYTPNTPAPAPQYPTPPPTPPCPTPKTPAPQYPAPKAPAPQTPAPQYPAPKAPAPQTPAPQYPAPKAPAPQTPAPKVPTPTPYTPPANSSPSTPITPPAVQPSAPQLPPPGQDLPLPPPPAPRR